MVVLIWKWLYFYSPPSHDNLELFFDKLTSSLSKANESYENFIVMEDFNIDFTNKGTKFDKSYSTSNHLKVPWISDFPETLWLWSMPYEKKILKIWASNYLPFPRFSHPKIKPLPENWPWYKFFCFWYPFQSPIHSNIVMYGYFSEVIWGQAYFTKIQKYIYIYFFFWKWQRFWTFEKILNFKGPKIKNRLFLWVHTWFS